MRCIALAIAATGLATAAPAARADDAARLALAREVLQVTHLAEKVRGLLPVLVPAVRQELAREMVDAPKREAAVRRVQAPSPEDLDLLMDEVAALYARELTEEDLSNALAFYRTPSGRNMLAKEAEIGGAIGTLAQHWAITLADRIAAERSSTAASRPAQGWREDDIAASDRAAVLQRYIDPMDRPEWTALRSVTLATLIAGLCRDVRLDQGVLDTFLATSGLDAVSMGDMESMNAIVAPAFSYFDDDRLKLVCAASDHLFGPNGRLVPNLLSGGNGLPKTSGHGYLSIPAFTSVPHGKG